MFQIKGLGKQINTRIESSQLHACHCTYVAAPLATKEVKRTSWVKGFGVYSFGLSVLWRTCCLDPPSSLVRVDKCNSLNQRRRMYKPWEMNLKKVYGPQTSIGVIAV